MPDGPIGGEAMQAQIAGAVAAMALVSVAAFLLGLVTEHRLRADVRRRQVIALLVLGAGVTAVGSTCCLLALVLLGATA